MPASEYAPPEGVTTEFKRGEAEILQLYSRKVFDPEHALDILILKTSLRRGNEFSSKLLPLVVRLTEEKPDEYNFDVYSFDTHGNCLAHTGSSVLRNRNTKLETELGSEAILRSHGYSVRGDDWVREEFDTDVTRLVAYGETIKEMIGGYPVNPILGTHSTVIGLMYNTLDTRP